MFHDSWLLEFYVPETFKVILGCDSTMQSTEINWHVIITVSSLVTHMSHQPIFAFIMFFAVFIDQCWRQTVLKLGQSDTRCQTPDARWTHEYRNLENRKWSLTTLRGNGAIRQGIMSHRSNSSCVSTASKSTSGDFTKSLACQQIPEGAAEGTYLCVHRESTLGQCDASIPARD